jgi:hypothetical protein
VLRDAQLASQVEKIVLHLLEHRSDLRRNLLGEQHADRAIQLVDLAERGDARAVLSDPRAVPEAGLAGVAGAGGDLRQAVSHQ